MKTFTVLGMALAAGCALVGEALAQAATNVDCTGCVHVTDLANNSVTSAKIVNGTVASVDIKPSAVTSEKIQNGTIVLADLAPAVRTSINDAIANVTTALVTVSAASVAGANCPSSRIPVAASCECDDSGGSRNLGVLFTCAVSGTGAVAACSSTNLRADLADSP